MSQFAHGIYSVDLSNRQLVPPVWFLGSEHADSSDYRQAFEALLWFTYRRDFAPMEPYAYTSDAGWGCMLRTAQMLLAEALRRLHKVPNDHTHASMKQLLTWFADAPDTSCAFSIHNMVQLGLQYDKLPGEWYGPTTASQVLRELVNKQSREQDGRLVMYVPQDGVVYSDEVDKLCVSHLERNVQEKDSVDESDSAFCDPLLNPPKSDEQRAWTKAVLLLIPLRLGLDEVNERYMPAVTESFRFPQSVGIIGGKKGHSVYFVAAQDDQLHLLDPHEVQPTPELSASFPTASHVRTVHSTTPLAMGMRSVDPSMALGFLCCSREEYLDFGRRVEELQKSGGLFPFAVAHRRPDYASTDAMDDCVSGESGNENGLVSSDIDDDDEYVLI